MADEIYEFEVRVDASQGEQQFRRLASAENQAKAAAAALFDRLDGDHDGTLDRKELRGRVSAKELFAADPDNDRTLTKGEYLALVEARFKAADPDKDGTLDAKELRTVARLLK